RRHHGRARVVQLGPMRRDPARLLRHQRDSCVAEKRLELTLFTRVDSRPEDTDDHGSSVPYASRVLGELRNVLAGSRSTTGSSTSSILVRRSASSLIPDAAALSLTCSGADVPMTALSTCAL